MEGWKSMLMRLDSLVGDPMSRALQYQVDTGARCEHT